MQRNDLINRLHRLGVHKVHGKSINDMHIYSLMRVLDWFKNKQAKLIDVCSYGDDGDTRMVVCGECGTTQGIDEYMENNGVCIICGK